jgi:hypothetical protein
MTDPLGKEINHCYSLIFTGESELREGCKMKALLCFESCRKYTIKLVEKSGVFEHGLIRSARKESQLLREFGMPRRAYRILKKVERKISGLSCPIERLLVYSQLTDLCNVHDPELLEMYRSGMLKAARDIK